MTIDGFYDDVRKPTEKQLAHLRTLPFEEEKLLRVARMHERETDWHTRRPKL